MSMYKNKDVNNPISESFQWTLMRVRYYYSVLGQIPEKLGKKPNFVPLSPRSVF